MRVNVTPGTLTTAEVEERRKRHEKAAADRIAKLGIKPKIRKIFDLRVGDHARGQALDRRVRAKLLGF
jgi:hypothetical protein